MNTIGEGCEKTAEAKNWFLKERENINFQSTYYSKVLFTVGKKKKVKGK